MWWQHHDMGMLFSAGTGKLSRDDEKMDLHTGQGEKYFIGSLRLENGSEVHLPAEQKPNSYSLSKKGIIVIKGCSFV